MKSLIVLIVIGVVFYTCNTDDCSVNLGFELDYHLFDHVTVENKNYCDLVNLALKGDEVAILNLSKVSVGDFASYQHGAVLLEVIDKCGKIKYLRIISCLNPEEIKFIYYTIDTGLDFTPNEKYKNKRIENVFPEMVKYFE